MGHEFIPYLVECRESLSFTCLVSERGPLPLLSIQADVFFYFKNKPQDKIKFHPGTLGFALSKVNFVQQWNDSIRTTNACLYYPDKSILQPDLGVQLWTSFEIFE